MSTIYGYKSLPTDLQLNGASLEDYVELPEIHRIINNKYQFYMVYKLDGQNVEYLKKGNFVKAKVMDGSYQYFELTNPVKNLNSISIVGRHIGFMLNRNFIENSFTNNGNGKTIMANLYSSLVFKQKFIFDSDLMTEHQFTAKEVQPLEAMIGSNNGNQNLVGVTKGELEFDNYTITLKERLGADNYYQVSFGHNLESVEETIDEDGIINSLYLIGGTPETDYNENKDPIVFKYLEIDGVTDDTRRIGKRENSNITEIDELKKWGQSLFDKDRIHEPSITHDISMVDLSTTVEYKDIYRKLSSLQFGDTVHVNAKKIDINVQERLVECVWYPTIAKYKSMVLGNDLSMYTYQVENKTQVLQQDIINRQEMLVENVKNATAWITGNKGGYVILRPEKAPNEILIMDNPDVAKAKKVWRWNLGGLGYSSNGVNGPYGTAITQDGKIVADFIKAGVLNGVQIQAENENFLIDIYDGKIKFVDVIANKQLGQLFSSSSAATGKVNGMAISQYPGYIFSLNSADGNGKSTAVFQIPADSTIDNPKANLYGDINIKGNLYVNGVKIDTNGGGQGGGGSGNWNGQYPSEVISSADKFAWEAWATLISMGYSQAAAAGILGNIQGEAGPSMNPDVKQSGGSGPGYGAIQFDGSSYPLIGKPTSDGEEYFQRLHNASGVGGNYKEMSTQMKVVNWTMTNGQWIGAVSPTSVSGFKSIGSPEQAAYAFEKNFERPAADHPERQAWAREWYEKFKNLKIPTQAGTAGLQHLESILGQRIGNGQCYGLSAEYSGFLGGCGLGAGTKYGLSHVIGNTMNASDIGSAYNWKAVGWSVIKNPSYSQLVVGAIINWSNGGRVGSWYADPVYGHTGIIRGLNNGKIQTYEQNTELGQVCAKLERTFYSSSDISSIVIPAK